MLAGYRIRSRRTIPIWQTALVDITIAIATDILARFRRLFLKLRKCANIGLRLTKNKL